MKKGQKKKKIHKGKDEIKKTESILPKKSMDSRIMEDYWSPPPRSLF